MSLAYSRRAVVLLTIALLAFCVPLSRAAYVMSFQQVGPDVVATGSGSLDVTDLALQFSGTDEALVEAFDAFGVVGPITFVNSDVYKGIAGPSSFGSGNNKFPSSGSGPIVALAGGANSIGVHQGYVSGTPLALSTDTYNSSTFTTLGITPGTYDYTWGTGPDADSFTVQIGPAVTPAPLPAGLWAALLAIPLAVVARKRMLAV